MLTSFWGSDPGPLRTLLLSGVFALTGCAASPSATGEPPTPSPSATQEPTPTASPSPSPTPSPTPEPSPSPTDGRTGEGELVFRIAPWSDIVMPSTMSLMADGRLTTIRIGGPPDALTQRRLTDEGVELVRREILATGLFGESAFFPPVPRPGHELPGRGNSGFIVDAAIGGEQVEVGWVSITSDEVDWAEPSPERERLEPLGQRLTTLEEWLPPEAWADPTPTPYVPERYRLFVTAQPWGGDLDDLPPEASAVDWPLDGTVLTYGEANPDASPDYAVRCGIVTAAEADRVRAALSAVGASMGEVASAFVIGASLGDRSSTRVVEVALEALHPHEDSCEGAWPPSFW